MYKEISLKEFEYVADALARIGKAPALVRQADGFVDYVVEALPKQKQAVSCGFLGNVPMVTF